MIVCEGVLFAVYVWSSDAVARGGAAAGIYFFACCCALLFVARRRQIREIARGVRSVASRQPADGYAVADALWVAALASSLGLVTFAVSPSDAFGPDAYMSVVAFVGAAPLLKALWASFRS